MAREGKYVFIGVAYKVVCCHHLHDGVCNCFCSDRHSLLFGVHTIGCTLISSKSCLPAWTLSIFASCRSPTAEVGGLLLVWPDRPTLLRYMQGAFFLTSVNFEHRSSANKQKLKPVEEVQTPVKIAMKIAMSAI